MTSAAGNGLQLAGRVMILFMVAAVLAISVFLAVDSLSDVNTLMTVVTASQNNTVDVDTTFTLDPNGELITSYTGQVYNSTWLDFDSDNDIVNITSGQVAGATDSTICAWVNITNSSGPTTQVIATNDKYQLQANNFNTRFLFTSDGGGTNAVAATNSIVINTWQLICARRNSTGTASLYLNGVLTGSSNQNSGTPTIASTTNMYFGARQSLSSDLNGSIDEITIWTKNLDPNVIKQYYNESLLGTNLGQGVPIIAYHCIGEDNACGNSRVGETNFTEQMSYLNSSGYETITLKNYYDWVQGNFALPEKPVILMFDDIWNSTIIVAKPIMDTYGYIGDAAVVTSYAGNTPRMSWENISTLYDAGWGITSHSVSHTDMLTLSLSQRDLEFSKSRDHINGNISYLTETWVYPLNSHNGTTDAECSGYYNLCTGDAGTVNSHSYKSYNLTGGIVRISITNTTTLEDYKTRVNLYDNLTARWRINENEGSFVNDSSGNNNNGIITNATWNNDGILVTLSGITDYTLSATAGTIRLLNPIYSYSMILSTWNYDTESGSDRIAQNVTIGIASFFGEAGTIIALLAVIIILAAIVIVVAAVSTRKMNL